MIHLTPVNPARIQEFVVQAIPAGRPRSARPVDISPRRPGLGEAFLGQMSNVRVLLPRPKSLDAYPEAAASVRTRPITLDCGDEAVGVNEADDQ
jgi:hypothetical protein